MSSAATPGAPPARSPLAEPSEVASYLKVTEKTLAQWRWRKTGPTWLKVGAREVRYRWEEVDAWLASRATAAQS